MPLLNVQLINSWWWTEELSETCRISCQNKFVKLVYLVGFIVKKFVTMHGHTNVKGRDEISQQDFLYAKQTLSLLYTLCYVWMAKRCHEASYVVAYPITNILVCVFFYVRCHESSQPISRSHTKRTTWAIYDGLYNGNRENGRKKNYGRRRYFD